MGSPEVTTSTRSPENSATPPGRSGVTTTPVRWSRDVCAAVSTGVTWSDPIRRPIREPGRRFKYHHVPAIAPPSTAARVQCPASVP